MGHFKKKWATCCWKTYEKKERKGSSGESGGGGGGCTGSQLRDESKSKAMDNSSLYINEDTECKANDNIGSLASRGVVLQLRYLFSLNECSVFKERDFLWLTASLVWHFYTLVERERNKGEALNSTVWRRRELTGGKNGGPELRWLAPPWLDCPS